MSDFVCWNWDNCQIFKFSELCYKQYYYIDIVIQCNVYKKGLIGISDVDIVSVIEVVIVVFWGDIVLVFFSIKDKLEVLLILVYYMGDFYQFMYVVLVYLDVDGQLIDLDKGIFDYVIEICGGNSFKFGIKNLYLIWDSILQILNVFYMG